MKIPSESQDPFELVEQAIMRIGWLGQRQFMQLLAEEQFDLTVPQYHTLMYLSHCPDECKMSDLARATHQSAASLTGVVDRLLEKQLVERGRPKGDRRQVVVSATEQGRTLLLAIKQARRTEMKGALAHLQAAELHDLLRLLNVVLEGMLQIVQGRDLRERHEEET